MEKSDPDEGRKYDTSGRTLPLELVDQSGQEAATHIYEENFPNDDHHGPDCRPVKPDPENKPTDCV